MDTEILAFKENMDAWVKQIRNEVSQTNGMGQILEENTGNIQHNYELIHELRDEIEQLKQEINALKLVQIISLRQKIEKKH